MKRVTFIAALCILTLIVAAFPGRADAADIMTKAEVGFDNIYKIGKWTPVRVRLQNTGSDLEGSLEVVVPHYDSSVSYSVPVVVPRDTAKEYTVMVKIHGIINSLDVILKNKSGKAIEMLNIKNIGTILDDTNMFGIVTDDSSSLSYFKDASSSGGFIFSYFNSVTMSAETFPDQKEILDNFAILVINNLDSSSLTKDQTTALNAWLKAGGVLIIGTGVNGSRTLSGISPSIVPVSAGEILSLDNMSSLEEMSGVLVTGSKLTVMELESDGGEAVLTQDDQILAKRIAAGKGYIYISAFDLGTEPVISWDGNLLFWDNLLNQTLPNNKITALTNPGALYKETPVDLLAAIPAMDMPPTTYILFLFLLYLGMVGPLNYVVLKKIDKREWSWLTVPALSIMFAILIYGIGFGSKGNEIVLSNISVLNLESDSEQGTLTRYMGVFMPSRGDYKIDVDSDGLISLIEEKDYTHFPRVAQGGHIETRITQGRPSQIVFEGVNVWMMKTFLIDEHQADTGTIDAKLEYEDGQIVGTLTNNTGYPLEDLILYTPFSYKRIGNIATGESKSVALNAPLTLQPGYGGYYHMMLDDLFPYYGRSNNEERELYVRRQLFNQLVVYEKEHGKGFGSISIPQGFTVEFFAFFEPDTSDMVKINNREPDSDISRGVVKGILDIELDKEGQVIIPPGYVFGEFEPAMSNNAYFEGSHVMLNDQQSYAIFSVDMSPYRDLKDLKANIGIFPEWGSISIMVYDQSDEKYVQLNEYAVYNGYTFEINDDNKHRVIDTEGFVYIRVSSIGQEYTRVLLPYVSVEGRTD